MTDLHFKELKTPNEKEKREMKKTQAFAEKQVQREKRRKTALVYGENKETPQKNFKLRGKRLFTTFG